MNEQIKNVMAVVFEVDSSEITPSSSTSTLENWDSLNHMNLIVALEEEFKMRFSDEEIVEMTSFEAVEKIVASKN